VKETTHRLDLRLLPERLAICRLTATDAIPDWISHRRPEGGFLSITRTPDELSLVCSESLVPAGVTAQRGWRGLAVRGPIDFEETGVLLSLAAPLAASRVSIFAVSTYDTDYLLVRAGDLGLAVDLLRQAGHRIA